jgi:hypothetical protein
MYVYLLRKNIIMCEFLLRNGCEIDNACYEFVFLLNDIELFDFCLKKGKKEKNELDEYFKFMENTYLYGGVIKNIEEYELENTKPEYFLKNIRKIFRFYGGNNDHKLIEWYKYNDTNRYTTKYRNYAKFLDHLYENNIKPKANGSFVNDQKKYKCKNVFD